MKTYAIRERGGHFSLIVGIYMFLIQKIVQKLLRKISRLLVSFIKIPALLKIGSKINILRR